MADFSDEEALLDTRQREPVALSRHLSDRARAMLFVSTLLVFAVMAWWGSPAGFGPQQQQSVLLPKHRFEQKESIGEVAVEPHEALENNEKRQQLLIEQDLKTLLLVHVSQRQGHYRQQSSQEGAALCEQQAGHLFDDVVAESDMAKELEARELAAFKERFSSGMKKRCKDIISERLWKEAAGQELERQKPVMTAALSASLNSAGLGFTVKMHDWLLHESVGTMDHHMGLLPTSPDQQSVLKRGDQGRQAEHLPQVFRAELKWPMCKEEILKIHNQGHCGSCWAFGGLASVDARMCIATDGKWDAPEDILSRLHVTSCAPNDYYPGHDGCQGGMPHWAMEMMATRGVASSACLPYYISGEGAEHFEHQDVAPPCESHCQGGYSLPLRNDTFSSAGAANYDWLVQVHGDPAKIATTKNAIYQEGPVAFAFNANQAFMGYSSGVFSVCTGHDRANHAVYAFGWGIAARADGGEAVEYFEASNSWGSDWGADGHFRIHPRCITDVIIPGSIESTVVGHLVGTVDANVPRDPDNEYWPWPKPDECPFSDGCVTDMEGAGNYSATEVCVSKALNGKPIRVVDFDTERGYDLLHVNGIAFSGAVGAGLDLDALNGMVVDAHGLKFESDSSLNKPGFKICQG